jgi:hypothetical protein
MWIWLDVKAMFLRPGRFLPKERKCPGETHMAPAFVIMKKRKEGWMKQKAIIDLPVE